MKKAGLSLLLWAACISFSSKSFSQLVNDGATIKVQPGAVLFVQGNFENKNAGSISNDGKIEVQGNFLNTATYNSATADDSLVLSGGGNVTFNSGASVLTNLWINKTAATNRVTLTATALLSGKLDYDQGLFTTDPIANPSYLFSAPAAATFDFAAGKEIVGNVRRTGWANGTAIAFNQSNMHVTTNGGTQPTDVTVTMIPLSESGDPTDNEREVKRKFQFAQTGGTGFTADVRMPYLAGELNTNTEANLVPWGRFTGVWNGRLTPVTRDAANDWVSTTGIPQADLINEWKLADPKYTFNISANLRGAWNAGSMNNTINSILPLTQPYNVSPFLYTGTESVAPGFFAAHPNIVDWVLVQFRKPSTGNGVDATSVTEIGTKAAFILQNGSVVELDGVTPLTIDIRKQGSGFFVLRHRNHLAVMSNSINTISDSYNNDFKVLANSYVNTDPSITNTPMVLMPSSTQYGLWAGNANGDGGVNGSDLFIIRQRANQSSTGYEPADVNMDGGANGSDLFLARQSANQSVVTHSSRGAAPKVVLIKDNPNPPKSHVPVQ
jgi:hypothetical protein